MNNNSTVLWRAFIRFFRFSPSRQAGIIFLMFAQGLTAGIGLLLIIPLLHSIGLETGVSSENIATDFTKLLVADYAPKTKLILIISMYILVVGLIASLRFYLTVRATEIQHSYVNSLRIELYRELLHCQWRFITSNKMTDFLHGLTGQIQAIGNVSHLTFLFLKQLLLSFMMIILSLLIDSQLTLFGLLMGGILFLALYPLNKVIYKSGSKQLINYKAIFQMLAEQLTNLKMIKGFGAESYHVNKVACASHAIEKQHTKIARIGAFTQWVYLLVSVLAFSAFIYTAIEVFATPPSATILLLIIFSRLLLQISGLQKTYQQMLHHAPSIQSVFALIANCEEVQEHKAHDNSILSFTQAIHLRNIHYSPPNTEHPLFEGLTASIKKYQTLALLGPSGAGKSTLADIISGLISPDSGELVIDNTKLTNQNRQSWRQHVAYFTQEVFLFNESVRNNLEWVCKGPLSDKAIWDALRLAAADSFIAKLPDGLETTIGDRGTQLSGGERQRLALARALLANPKLLILDEATNALDSENEATILAVLEQLKGKLTIIVITHSEKVAGIADNIVNLTMHKRS